MPTRNGDGAASPGRFRLHGHPALGKSAGCRSFPQPISRRSSDTPESTAPPARQTCRNRKKPCPRSAPAMKWDLGQSRQMRNENMPRDFATAPKARRADAVPLQLGLQLGDSERGSPTAPSSRHVAWPVLPAITGESGDWSSEETTRLRTGRPRNDVGAIEGGPVGRSAHVRTRE